MVDVSIAVESYSRASLHSAEIWVITLGFVFGMSVVILLISWSLCINFYEMCCTSRCCSEEGSSKDMATKDR
ncbi:hypothetical protein GL50803_004816 [Giardia duodenalis]|uniref:Uncharacterized protein n=1 Tax=Giardia intestinalis (strain ATCC 50803 / WB clone C6) TaxID=184922 RepID=A8BR43_GIAIC|nr:hypothetical protein GL50803_004816 [Giardia intestinalis]KAE8304288.1 hypothetical protein GL50803_004816 [Giardia intestinalis]|eukprot:XP_001705421.1 Hypothetical protein GL50803_4816 [Giardia lamblia ATCC 50803]